MRNKVLVVVFALVIFLSFVAVGYLAMSTIQEHTVKQIELESDMELQKYELTEVYKSKHVLEQSIEDYKRYIIELESVVSMYAELPAYNMLLKNDPVDTIPEIDKKLEMVLKAKGEFPTGNPLGQSYYITSYFGDDVLGHDLRIHMGIDLIPSDPYTQSIDIFVVQDGQVIEIGLSKIYGKYVLVEHTGGYQTFYAHLSKIFYTADWGKVLTKNDKIGIMGNTGRVYGKTGIHLHYEVRYFNPETGVFERINPLPFLKGE